MKIEDLEIFIENALRNVKRGIWDVSCAKEFIYEKINEFFGDLGKKLGKSLDDK